MRFRGWVLFTLFGMLFLAWLLWILFPGMSLSNLIKTLAPFKESLSNLFWLWVLLLLLSAFVNSKWGWKQYVEADKGRSPHSRILVDTPIGGAHEDAFRREQLARVLARELILPPQRPSVVIALEGRWGCGKSSLLVLIERELRETKPAPVVVHFNPWILTSIDDLVDGFFKQLADECARQDAAPSLIAALDGVKNEIERDRINGVVRFLLQGWEFLSRLVLRPEEGRDFLSRKEGISNLLNKLRRPVVVLVDDVDRLAPEQIRAVFQLIKTVGDFRGVGYLIAYDPVPVYPALDFGQSQGFGKDYKDKIVQVTVPFPAHPLSEAEKYLRTTWEQAAREWKLEVSGQDAVLLEEAIRAVLRTAHTPRHIRVIINDTFLKSSLVAAEISIADLFVFACLSVRFPEVVSMLRRRPTLVTGLQRSSSEILSTSASETGKDKVDPLRSEVEQLIADQVEREQAETLLRFLFPTDDAKWVAVPGRLRNENNFWLMLYGGVRGSLFSNIEAERLLYQPDLREAILDTHQFQGSLVGFLVYATQNVSGHRPVEELLQLFASLLGRCSAAYREKRVDLVPEFAPVLFKLIRRAGNDAAEKLGALQVVCFDRSFFSLGHDLLLHTLRYVGAWSDGVWRGGGRIRRGNDLDWLSDGEVDELSERWVDFVGEFPIDLLMSREPSAIGILFRRAQLAGGNFADVQAELTSWLEQGDQNVSALSAKFPPGVTFGSVDKLILPHFDLVGAFKRAGVPAQQVERLLEDCPRLGDVAFESRAAASSPLFPVDLDVPVTYLSLSGYTEWKFPGMAVSDRLQKALLRDLDHSKYATLRDLDSVVDRASKAVAAYAKEQPNWFQFGTDYITKSLGFVDGDFRGKHGFSRKSQAAFIQFKDLLPSD